MGIPSFTTQLDDLFLNTWLEIAKEAEDVALGEHPVWGTLKAKGCFKPQEGGDYITRRVRYNLPETQTFQKGTQFTAQDPNLETMAMWPFRFCGVDVTRSATDDRANRGKYRIKEYVAEKLTAAKDALSERFEEKVFQTFNSDESGTEPASLNDIVAPYASRTTGTLGKIDRSNSWWQANYKAFTTPIAVNLVSDMRNLFNTVSQGGKTVPDIIISSQNLYEMYEDFGVEGAQIVLARNLDLSFETQMFKGAIWVWSPNINISGKEQLLMLNSKKLEVVYDPSMWLTPTEWKPIPDQLERRMQIVCAYNLITTAPHRHGRLYEA